MSHLPDTTTDNNLQALPLDILGAILNRLDEKSILNLRLVSRHMKAIVSDTTFHMIQVFEEDAEKMTRIFPRANVQSICRKEQVHMYEQTDGDYDIVTINHLKSTNEVVQSKRIPSFVIDQYSGDKRFFNGSTPLFARRVVFVHHGKVSYSKSCVFTQTGDVDFQVYRNHRSEKLLVKRKRDREWKPLNTSSYEFSIEHSFVADIDIPQVRKNSEK